MSRKLKKRCEMKEMFKHFFVEEVAEFSVKNDVQTFCEPVHTLKEPPEADQMFIRRFFTVYGKIPAPTNEEAAQGVPGGVEAIYDAQDRKDAEKLCDWLNNLLRRAGAYED
jgi:hypothetical protein